MDYRNVRAEASLLDEMLGVSGGKRAVPVIVEGGQTTVGFGGT